MISLHTINWRFYGNVNILKGGLVYSKKLIDKSVSPTYSYEIQMPFLWRVDWMAC